MIVPVDDVGVPGVTDLLARQLESGQDLRGPPRLLWAGPAGDGASQDRLGVAGHVLRGAPHPGAGRDGARAAERLAATPIGLDPVDGTVGNLRLAGDEGRVLHAQGREEPPRDIGLPGLGPFAALEQPVGEVRAGTRLGNSHVNGPNPGVQVPVAVAVALGPVLGAGLTVLGAAHRVGIGRQQDVDHGLQQTAHQVRGGLSQSLIEDSSRADNVRSDHRDDALSRTRWKADSKNHTVTAPTTNTRASHRQLHHTTGHYSLRLHALLENYQRIPLNVLGMKASWDADEFWQEAFKAGTEPRFSPDQYGQQVG